MAGAVVCDGSECWVVLLAMVCCRVMSDSAVVGAANQGVCVRSVVAVSERLAGQFLGGRSRLVWLVTAAIGWWAIRWRIGGGAACRRACAGVDVSSRLVLRRRVRADVGVSGRLVVRRRACVGAVVGAGLLRSL